MSFGHPKVWICHSVRTCGPRRQPGVCPRAGAKAAERAAEWDGTAGSEPCKLPGSLDLLTYY